MIVFEIKEGEYTDTVPIECIPEEITSEAGNIIIVCKKGEKKKEVEIEVFYE
jgi:hypothetical protein